MVERYNTEHVAAWFEVVCLIVTGLLVGRSHGVQILPVLIVVLQYLH